MDACAYDMGEEAHRLVWSGFHTADEIFAEMEEALLEEEQEVDPDQLRARIAEEFRLKRLAEREWPAVTDCDRLDQVFHALNQRGILALHNAGATHDDGMDEVAERYDDAGGDESGITGYCFYHRQDLERVLEGKPLRLAFGSVEGEDAETVAVGEAIQKALTEAGFQVKWEGTAEKRLRIKGITWQKRNASG